MQMDLALLGEHLHLRLRRSELGSRPRAHKVWTSVDGAKIMTTPDHSCEVLAWRLIYNHER